MRIYSVTPARIHTHSKREGTTEYIVLVLIGRDVFIWFKGDILCLIEKEKCVVYDHQTSRSSFLHIPLKSLKDSINEISTHDWWTFPSNLYSKFQIIL